MCTFILADQSLVKGEMVRFNKVRIGSYEEKNPLFVVMNDLSDDVIIGAKLMQRLGITLDLPNERIKLEGKVMKTSRESHSAGQ